MKEYMPYEDYLKQVKSTLCRKYSYDLVDHSSCRNRALYYDRQIRPIILQNATHNSCEDKRYARVWKQRKTQIFFHCFWHFHDRRADPGAEVLADSACAYVEEGKKTSSQYQMKVKRSTQIHDSSQKAYSQHGMKIFSNCR